MIKLYRDGKTCECVRAQIETMVEAGWSLTPEATKPKASSAAKKQAKKPAKKADSGE